MSSDLPPLTEEQIAFAERVKQDPEVQRAFQTIAVAQAAIDAAYAAGLLFLDAPPGGRSLESVRGDYWSVVERVAERMREEERDAGDE